MEAAFTLPVLDNLTLELLGQTLVDIYFVLDVQSLGVKGVDFACYIAAPLASALRHHCSLESVCEKVPLACGLKLAFQLIEELIKELLRVSLLATVGRLAVLLLERETELGRVDKSSLRHLKVAEKPLELAEEVVVDHTLFILDHLLRSLIKQLE